MPDTAAQTFVPAPAFVPASPPLPRAWVTESSGGPPGIHGVNLSEGERVEWIWTHTPNGSYVSGFTIRRKGESDAH